MIDAIMKKIGEELQVNPAISYSPSLNLFTATVSDVSLRDINGNYVPNHAKSNNAENAMLNLYLTLKQSVISVSGYPKDEEYAYVGGRFERVYNVDIETTESA